MTPEFKSIMPIFLGIGNLILRMHLHLHFIYKKCITQDILEMHFFVAQNGGHI